MAVHRSLVLLAVAALSLYGFGSEPVASPAVPEFTADGRLMFPAGYRRWTYLSSGFDMSYRARAAMPDMHMFDNVFVNPDAYESFLKTASWPDGTVLVLEHRGAQTKGSINVRGSFQTSVMDIEVHVKSRARFAGAWAFFGFAEGDRSSTVIPPAAACYACHSAHGALDTTFVQFYPTLLPVVKAKAAPGHAN